MPNNDIFIDGTGKFQQSTENAGDIKFGEFSQTSINTGHIAISALFTGSAVNSGTIGNFLPYDTAVLVQTQSALWNAAYDMITEGGGGALEITSADITDFNTATDARISAAAGVSIASLVNGTVPSSQLPSYVDDVVEYANQASFPVTGETGVIYVDTTTKLIYRWSGSTYIEISPSPGSTDSVAEGSNNLYFTDVRASAAAPVQSVAGKTGAVVLSSSDISGLQAAVQAYAPAQAVSSVAGKTGVVTLSTSDIAGLNAAIAASSSVTSVAGRTGAVTLSATDIAGLDAATDARIAAQGGVTLDSPAFTGTPTAPTAAAGTSNSQIANTAFVINNRGDKYRTTSTTSTTIDNSNGKTITVGTGLSYTSQQDITVVYDASNHMHGKVVSYDSSTGALVFDVNSHTGSGTYSQWTVNVGGITSSGDVSSVAGRTGAVVLSASDIQGFDAKLTVLNANSGSWQQAYTTVSTNSAGWVNSVASVAGRTGTVVLSASDITNFNTAADARITAAAGTSVASLVNGTVPSSQLPSYVDDVVEYSALASFPGTGETGKIYVDTTAGKIYRWSGSTYIEISPSPGSTDSVVEGSTNLYFTDARAVNALQSSLDGKLSVSNGITPSVLALGRQDSVNEGGQLGLCRASDNTVNWNIDVYGSGSAPRLRIHKDAGGEKMTILDDGSVGIGTSAPGYKLDVQGTGSFTGSSGVGAIRVAGAGGSWFWIDNPNASTMRFSSGVTAGSNAMVLDSSGNVGIGTDSPASKLHVQGVVTLGKWQGIKSVDDTSNLFIGGGSNYDKGAAINMYGADNGFMSFAVGTGATNSEKMRFTADGYLGIGTVTPAQMLDVAGSTRASGDVMIDNANAWKVLGLYHSGVRKSYFAYNNPDNTLWMNAESANSQIALATSGTEKVRITSEGRVGIGTSLPLYKLQVEGDIYAREAWLRSSGNSGWYNESHGGGWFMQDSTYIRSYNNKQVYIDNVLTVDSSIKTNPGSQWGISLVGNQINTGIGHNNGSELALNFSGYNEGFTQFRSLNVYNGKGGSIAYFDANNGRLGIGTMSPAYKLDVQGNVRTTEEVVIGPTSNANQMRVIHGNYGLIFRNDGANFYLLPTNSGDQYGGWNALRPFVLNVATGAVSMHNGVSMNGGATVTGGLVADNISLNGASVVTYTTPVTASGDFISLSINGRTRLIRLWDAS